LSEFGELLELMHRATARVRHVPATLAERRRPELLERAFRRWDEHEWRQLWAELGRFRQERTGSDAEHVPVVDGERWWEWSPAFGLRSHAEQDGVHHYGGLDLADHARARAARDRR
jgi:hypothetical protein